MMRRISSQNIVKDDRGATALEFAIIVPWLLVLLFGMIEFGFVFQAQLALTHAVREGARLASVNQYDAGIVESRAYPLTSGGGLSISASDLGTAVMVTATYPYEPQIMPLLPTITLSSEATMRKEY
jgi:Flp pilus assembly pilin Flp